MRASKRVCSALLAALVPTVGVACSRASLSREVVPVPARYPLPATLATASAVTPRAGITYTGPPGAPRVAFVGDSMLDVSRRTIRAVMQDEYQVALVTRGGWALADLRPLVRKVLRDPSGPPDALVVFEGTDDMFERNPHVARDVARENAAVRASGVGCFVRTTISAYTSTFYRGHPFDITINGLYEWSAATTPNWFVVDWNRFAAGTRDLYAWDLIHPTAYSTQWLVDTYLDTLQRECKVPPRASEAAAMQ
jgi:hypothetical protein